MGDLCSVSGLPMALDDAGQLVLGTGAVVEETKARRLDELTQVAMDPETCRGSDEVAYYMYNGVYMKSDAARLAGVRLRYELTLIPPRRIGREFVKTLGHRHCPEPQSGLDYAEVCEVLAGTAHFLFQAMEMGPMGGPRASTAFYVEARAGDKVIIPPGLDHCTINPGPDPLLFSDVIALGVTGIYDRFKATRGAAYLEIAEAEADGTTGFISNPTYQTVPPLKEVQPRDYPGLHLTGEEPLYLAFVQGRGANWPFLTDPRQFWSHFPDLAALLSS